MSQKIYTNEEILIEAQMAIFWHILHMLIRRYGNNPMGQLLTALTMVFLDERGMPPSMTDLCAATGLPKASVSRYVTTQIREGLVVEEIDPNDRRRRYLRQTAKGKKEWHWQLAQMDRLFANISGQAEAARSEGFSDTAESLMKKMTDLSQTAPETYKP